LARLEIEEARARLTREALADIDAGHVIDHQATQACVENLKQRRTVVSAALK